MWSKFNRNGVKRGVPLLWRRRRRRTDEITIDMFVWKSMRVSDTGGYCRALWPAGVASLPGLVHIYYIAIALGTILRSAAAVPILNDTRDNPLFIVRQANDRYLRWDKKWLALSAHGGAGYLYYLSYCSLCAQLRSFISRAVFLFITINLSFLPITY